MQLDDATTILGRADFFGVCDVEQRRLLAFASERRRHRAGAVIYNAGDAADGAFVLVSGTIATYQQRDDANPHVVSNPGAVLGVSSLILTRPRLVTLRAVDQVETLFVPRTAFLKLCAQAPDLAERAALRIREDLLSYLGAIEAVKGKLGRTD